MPYLAGVADADLGSARGKRRFELQGQEIGALHLRDRGERLPPGSHGRFLHRDLVRVEPDRLDRPVEPHRDLD